jgi:hypothetical protein
MLLQNTTTSTRFLKLNPDHTVTLEADSTFRTSIGAAAISHTHTIANVTDLQTTLNGKAATSHTHTVANITDIASNYVNLTGTQTISGSKTLSSSLNMAYFGAISKSYSVSFSSGATYGSVSIRGNTLGQLERAYFTSTSTIFDSGNSNVWLNIRQRTDNTALTSTGANGTTGGSIALALSLAQGDTIMMEVSDVSGVGGNNEPAVVTFTLGSADTVPVSLAQGITYRTSYSSTSAFYHYYFKVSHNGSTLYFDDSFRNTFLDSSTASSIIGQTGVLLYVGRIWRLNQ